MKRTTLMAAVGSAALGVSTIMVMANTRGPDFSILDANGNGELTLQEMQASALDRFGTADTDGDGFLSGAELEALSGLSWAPPNIMFCWAAGCWPPPTMTTMPATMVVCLSS